MNKFGFTAIISNHTSSFTIGGDGGGGKNHIINCLDKCLSHENTIFFNHAISKYECDKVFQENDRYIVVLDGVVLNKKQFDEKCNWFETIISLYKINGDTFFRDFRGSFGGLLYDKIKQRAVIFTDHIGSKFIYYSVNGKSFICSTIIKNIYDYLKTNNYHYNLSSESAYLLLTYGFLFGNRTLCDNIFKVNPGCYVIYENGHVEEKRYCILNNEQDTHITETDAIELFDNEFKRTVTLQFEKDREYGYKRHLVALSAGLDSRMTSWVAHELGYTDQLNITFSQSDYWDEIVPKQISRDLKHEWLYKHLDNGIWLYDLNEILSVTGGNVLYYGQAHGNSLLKYLNTDSLGMLHSGQLGDVVFATKSSNQAYHLGDGAYSTKYLDKIKDIKLDADLIPNKEIGLFYHRYFNGTNNGQITTMQYTETCSPFMDWDLMNRVLRVPVNLRYNHNIYKRWIKAKYPQAADYVWESIQTKITERTLNIKGRQIPVSQVLNKIMNRLHLTQQGTNTAKHMNPIGYYYATNDELRHFIYKQLNDDAPIQDEQLKQTILNIRDSGTPMEKIQAISLLGAARLFY